MTAERGNDMAATATAKKSRIAMVVDPVPSDRQTLRDRLEEIGYRVVTAEIGAEASERLQSLGGRVCLVIADLNATDREGIPLTQSVKKDNPGIEMILTSGLPLDPDRIHHRGADAFLHKPVTEQDLRRLVSGASDEVDRRSRGREPVPC